MISIGFIALLCSGSLALAGWIISDLPLTVSTFVLVGALGMAPMLAALFASSIIAGTLAPYRLARGLTSLHAATLSAAGAAFIGSNAFIGRFLSAVPNVERIESAAAFLMHLMGQVLLVGGGVAVALAIPVVGVEVISRWAARITGRTLDFPWPLLRVVALTAVLAFSLRGAGVFIEKNLDPLLVFNVASQ